jgi:AraC-like DNA-binding protein/mannose-6-phosphate isomerase-like protein (cupin superfamily)
MTNAELDAFLFSLSSYERLLRGLPEGLALDPRLDPPHIPGLDPGLAATIAAAFEEDARSAKPRFYLAPGALEEFFRGSGGQGFELREESVIPPGRGFSFSIHPRFFPVASHRHAYLELVYVYAGRISQVIEGEELELEEGDACFLDTMTAHSRGRAGEGDLVVDCLMRRGYFDAAIASRLAGGAPLSEFLVEASFGGSGAGGYLLARSRADGAARKILCRALREHFDPGPYSAQVLDSCLCILFAELARACAPRGRGADPPAGGAKGRIPEILGYIRRDCGRASLSSAAARFGLKPGYLGSLLRETLGKGFTEIAREARLERAASLLSSTRAPVDSIAREVGYENQSFFYGIFKERYGATPAEYRKRARPCP